MIPALPHDVRSAIWAEILDEGEADRTIREGQQFPNSAQLEAFCEIAMGPPHFASQTEIAHATGASRERVHYAVNRIKERMRAKR